MERNKIYNLYLELLEKYGEPEKYWPQWCTKRKSSKLKEEIVLEAILVQRTSWRNAEMAARNLKRSRLLSIKGIFKNKDSERLVSLVRPAGFYTTKPKRLVEFCRFICQNYSNWKNFCNEDFKTARIRLLEVYGIGPETADTILLFAADKPTFIIDEYTKRFARQNNLTKNLDYDYLKELFEKSLPEDMVLFQNYHVLIIAEQKQGKGVSMGIV